MAAPPLSSQNPRLNPEIVLTTIESGYLAYDPTLDTVHELNSTAALIVELCDGRRTMQGIRELTEPLLPVGQAGEIDRWIGSAVAAGLLIRRHPVDDPNLALGAERLRELARDLVERGNYQAAYVCGRQAAQLEPEDPEGWYLYGDSAHALGRRDEARDAFERYQRFEPDDPEVRHLLIALRRETPPARASDEYMREIYDEFSDSYDRVMIEDLEYRGPQRLLELVRSASGDRSGLDVLDLGCGTGLTGVAFKPHSASLTGVDLSSGMIERARWRAIYDRLDVDDIESWLRRCELSYDLIVACDSLVYFGDLRPVVTLAARCLKRGGLFAFALERGQAPSYQLLDSGRFAHHPNHVLAASADACLALAQMGEGFLRKDFGSSILGLFTVLRRET
jgi:predicted TPR repeat methyltransferase